MNKLEIGIVKCYIYTTLLYGAETQSIFKNRRNPKSMTLKYGYTNGMNLVEGRKTDKAVLEKLGVKKELLREVKIQQLKYFGI
jgi:hypothetical protein